MLSLLPNTATIIEQPEAVAYWDGAVRHRHTFDLLVIHRDGTHSMVAVK